MTRRPLLFRAARLVGLAAVCGPCWATPVDSVFPVRAPFDSARRQLIGPAGLRDPDLDLMMNYRGPDLRPLPAVNRLLRAPRRADSLVPSLRRGLGDTAPGGRVRADSLWRWLGAAAAPPSRGALPEKLRAVEAGLQAYLKPLSPAELESLRREAPPLFLHREEDTALNPMQAESLGLREDAATDEVMRIAEKLPRGRLAQAALSLDEVFDSLLASILSGGRRGVEKRLRGLSALGIPVDLGTEGDDVHRPVRGIVFDPGGNDRYEFPPDPRPGTWLIVVDAAGDDEYRASDSTGGGAGFLSLRITADLGGDDRYLAKDFAFGSALMGYSRLFDRAGNDLYQARCASLGFAFQGLGLLEDRSGNDVYSSYYLSQGVASTHGLGVLLEGSGNDQYLSRPAFVDDLRYRDHFLSLSQGFATGFSPRHSGGIGILWDRGGEDLYVADIFGQGSGYWFSLGLLMDDAGNDRFVAHQYAQGAGVHFASGILWDASGDDVRVSKGVGQGCGHDGGFGWLVDAQGNDKTLGVDKSFGAGSANGLGLYSDFAGDDVYEAGNPSMALGAADMRRDRGSLGFFLDFQGNDRYPPGFGNDSAWRTYDGKTKGYGYGRDR